VTVSVRQKSQVVGVLFALPLVHDESVVYRDTNDLIYAVLLEDGCKLVVARYVSGRAGRGECTRERKDDDRLILEDFVRGEVDPFVFTTGSENYLGYCLAFMIV
jgi:uncharacterized protein (DUF1015 family)